ncbi:MAG: LVIVD repeat-containing protein [Promethearchaeota archaeon]
MMFKRIFPILVLSLFLGTTVQVIVLVQAVDYADGPEPIGTWDSSDSLASVEGIALNDNYAYLALSGFGVQILDVSDPTNPQEVNSFELEGEAKTIVYANNKIYVGVSSELMIFDVQNPMSPSSVANISQHSTVYDIAVVGSYIYIADHSGSLMIATELAGNLYPLLPFANDYWCFGVVVAGDYACTATSAQGLVIWDISNKSAPAVVGTAATDENAYSIASYGENKVVVGGSEGYLGVFDISSKTNPSLLGSVTVTSDIMEIQVHEDTAIAADFMDGIVTLDLSFDSPSPGNRLLPDGERGHTVEINDQYIYGGMGFSGLMIWDINEAIGSLDIGLPASAFVLIGLSASVTLVFFRRKRAKD